MLDAAIKALHQMFTPPFRSILVRATGLAIGLLVVIMIVVYRISAWLTGSGAAWVEVHIGPVIHWPVNVLSWLLAIAIGLGLIVGAVFLMPAVTSLVASFFCDQIAERVEREHYPLDPPGVAVALPRAILEGLRTALLALIVYLAAVPFLLVAGAGAVIFFLATAYLLGRGYFELAAMRFRSVAAAKDLRRANRASVFIAGMFIAAFVSIPIVNLATPLFGMAFMVHVHKRLAGSSKRELIEPAQQTLTASSRASGTDR
jgi:CysZ protein